MILYETYWRKLVKKLLFLLLLIPIKTFAKNFPADAAVLNFTQVMFEYDEFAGADQYTIIIEKIAEEKQKPIRIKNNSLAYLVTTGLEFGFSYSWYYEAYAKTKKVFTSARFRFSIESSNLTDPNQVQIRITKNKNKQNQSNIFLLDYLGIAVNRAGQIIWYMPRTLEKKNNGDSTRRSLRITGSGSFTYLDNTNCYEKDIFGNILWKTPNDGKVSGDNTEYYHHDFRKLSNGNYVACSYKYIQEPNYFDNSKNWKVRYNTVIEYNKQNEVVWSWIEKDHVDGSLIFEDGDATINDFQGTHMNGLDFDDKQQAFIFSFRNTSRILKVDYKTKNVAFELGRYVTAKNGEDKNVYTLSNQHGPAWMPDGSILIYDNNVQKGKASSAITNPHLLIIGQPKNGNPETKLWDYECVSDSFPQGQGGKEGIAMPMQNGNIMVSQGSSHRIFEVNKLKEIVWEAFCFENKKGEMPDWQMFTNYRVFPATSLYPIYFTVQHLYDSKLKLEKNKLRINNEGSDDKIFSIEQYVENKNKQVKITRVLIKARSQFILNYNGNKKGFFRIFPIGGEDLSQLVAF